MCGTCNFQVAARAGSGVVEIRCAHDNEWRKDSSPDCGKWVEIIYGLSSKDKISIMDSERKASSGTEANRLAAEANLFAREANDIARSEAASAARSARWAKIAAVIAAAAAIIANKADINWLISWVVNSISKIFS